mmetsp:Transcript_26560/g.48780  ORF Transcript_26560/g.48780 Transcript_26560/m.48780 type:complete len:289 (-) Transcript_26560:140-1006(-)
MGRGPTPPAAPLLNFSSRKETLKFFEESCFLESIVIALLLSRGPDGVEGILVLLLGLELTTLALIEAKEAALALVVAATATAEATAEAAAAEIIVVALVVVVVVAVVVDTDDEAMAVFFDGAAIIGRDCNNDKPLSVPTEESMLVFLLSTSISSPSLLSSSCLLATSPPSSVITTILPSSPTAPAKAVEVEHILEGGGDTNAESDTGVSALKEALREDEVVGVGGVMSEAGTGMVLTVVEGTGWEGGGSRGRTTEDTSRSWIKIRRSEASRTTSVARRCKVTPSTGQA